MAQKKYASLTSLQNLVDNIKELFVKKTDLNTELAKKADSSHTHSISNVTNLQTTLDSKVPASRTVNGKALTSNITLSASDVGADTEGAAAAVQTNLNTVSDALDDHTTNSDIHLTAAERTKLSGIAAGAQVNTVTGVKGGSESTYRTGNINITKANIGLGNVDNTADANKSVKHATSADSATSATKATQDGNGKVISSTYETKSDASAKLTEAKTYADNAAATVKNDLLNNAGGAYDTLKELGDLIDDNKDAIDALNDVAAGKANASHTHTVANITDLTATATELNYMDGVTSSVQAQLDSKAPSSHKHSGLDITSGTVSAARLPVASESAAGIVNTESQSFKGEKTFTNNITTVGLRANAANTNDIGTSLAPFRNTNTKNLYIAPQNIGGSISHYGKFIAETTGTTSTKGVTRLEVGNFIEEGREGNAQGYIQIFNNDIGSVILETGHDDDRDIRVYLPENPGTLVTTDDLSGYAKSSHNHSASNIISGTLAVERGGTGNMNGYIQTGALSGSTVGALATAEGRNTTASGSYSHAEGNYTEATGSSSHAEGQNTTASGTAAHAEGENTTASGAYSHAEGENTIASSKHQHVQGKFNKEDSAGTYAHIVGNGTGTSTSSRSNAHTIDWNGNGWFAGDVYVGGISQSDTNASKVITEADQKWNLLYDSGEISDIVNSISNIDVSGYTNIQVLVRIYNDGDSVGSRNGSAIFKCENGKTYQFPVWANMFSKSINTVYVMATFNLVDGWLICPCASRLIGDATTFEDTEGGTAGSLAPTGSGMMKCTSPLSTLTISSLDQNSNYYFGMGSRVMVWGWNG